VEHALSKASRITVAAAHTENIIDMFHHYFTKTGTYNQLFAVIDYSFTAATLTLIINFIATFTWNFADLFIMLVCLALAERFHLFNQYLVSLQGKVIHHRIFNNLSERGYAVLYI
jgi:gustatory receptor